MYEKKMRVFFSSKHYVYNVILQCNRYEHKNKIRNDERIQYLSNIDEAFKKIRKYMTKTKRIGTSDTCIEYPYVGTVDVIQ